MLRKWIISAALCLLALGVFATVTAPRCLSSEEARDTVGGVCLDNFICSLNIATCNTFNFPTDPGCASSPSLPCRYCINGTQQLDNCVQSANHRCQSYGAVHNCGGERIGTCNGPNCSGSDYGTNCSPGPACDSSCP